MKKSQKQALAIGAGVAALAAAAAGTYFFTGKNGAKNRAKVAAWTDKAKKEVVKQIKGMEKVTKANYNKVVDTVLTQYDGLKNIDKSEILGVARELKSHWDSISKQLGAPKKATVKKAPAKKAAAKKK